MAPLRCVFYDPDAIDADSRLSARALEACERAGVEAYALSGDEDEVLIDGEPHELPEDVGPIAFVMRAGGYEPEQCIGVGAALAPAPLSAVWVTPDDLDVRGPHVRVAEDPDELLYDAVISELAERRSGK
jgi:hypothetical protein